MKRRLLAMFAITACASFGVGFAGAMALEAQDGVPDQRMGIVAASTGAKLVQCPSRGPQGCFRMFVEIRSGDGRNHDIAENFEEANYYLSQSFAYLSDGGVCKAWVDANLPRVNKYYSANRHWVLMPNNPITIAPQQPFAFPVLFTCDQTVQSGDTAQVQLSVGVASGTGRGADDQDAREVHFKWPQVEITARTIR